MKAYNKQTGAVSLFIVIFTALLMTILTVSFIQLMVRDQQQASTVDLSQSAYDSATAGVEDAKRALLLYQRACTSGNVLACNTIRTVFNSQECNTLTQLPQLGLGSDPVETRIQQSVGDVQLDQAYTCVKVLLNTDDYLSELQVDESKVIQLRGTSAFDRIELSWFSERDLTTPVSPVSINGSAPSLPTRAAWPANRPSLMRAQLIQPNNNFTAGSFDNNTGNNFAHTLFLYPSTVGTTSVNFSDDFRRSSANSTPRQIRCSAAVPAGGYACRADMVMPRATPAGQPTYLALTSFYNESNIQIRLRNGAAYVQLDGVQPQVDSTGRANSLFRRIEARVELTDETYPFPESALDLSGNLCKNFMVTDAAADYSSSCTP